MSQESLEAVRSIFSAVFEGLNCEADDFRGQSRAGVNWRLSNNSQAVRLMLLLWTSIIAGGLGYFIVIGLTHH